LDYDHNAPNPDHLRATHKPIYEAVRLSNPDVPIIMLPRPEFFYTRGIEIRNEIVRATYDFAKANGDDKVYFIPSHELMSICEDNGTVDGSHPTDFGFFSIATAVSKILDKLFEVKSNQF
jgi:hypothetical protein